MALVLDIDGTLEPSDPAQVQRLTHFAHKNDIPIYINTARSARYCAHPHTITTRLASNDRHYCLSHPDPVTSKIKNMRTIQEKVGTDAKDCLVLIDDRLENIRGVVGDGFKGVHVDASVGIDNIGASNAIAHLNACLSRRNY